MLLQNFSGGRMLEVVVVCVGAAAGAGARLIESQAMVSLARLRVRIPA